MAQQWGRTIWFGYVPSCCQVTNGPTLQIYVSKIFQRDIFISDRTPGCLDNIIGEKILLVHASKMHAMREWTFADDILMSH